MKAVLIASFVFSTGLFAQNPRSVKPPFGQSSGSTGTTIIYHGGKVLGTIGAIMYAVYYGNFPSTTTGIVNAFLSSLSGSPQYNVDTTYYQLQNGTESTIMNALTLGKVYYDTSYSLGSNLGNNGPVNILQKALTGNRLPVDSTAIYLVMTSPDVKAAGVWSSYCAYHSSSSTIVSGSAIHYAYVPDPGSLTGKAASCDGNHAVYGETATPNGDPGADEMTDSLFHEISEIATDPDIQSWYTQKGAENADLCNFNYGQTYTVAVTINGKTEMVHANANLGGRNYLIQTLWPRQNTGCLNTY
jgi:hypothetical protein